MKEYKEIETDKNDMKNLKFDSGKSDWSLLPLETIETAVKRMTIGREKYARDSWKQLSDGKNRYFSALMRHIVEYRKGNRWDEDPRFPNSTHLQAALTNMIFLVWLELQDIENDKTQDTKGEE